MVMGPMNRRDIRLFVRTLILLLFVRQLQQVRCLIFEGIGCMLYNHFHVLACIIAVVTFKWKHFDIVIWQNILCTDKKHSSEETSVFYFLSVEDSIQIKKNNALKYILILQDNIIFLFLICCCILVKVL